MIIADIHTHTIFSGDSNTPMETQADVAIKDGLKYLCFTDHHDLYYPEAELKDGTFGNIFLLNFPAYFKKAAEVKRIYEGRLNILTGVELGLCEKALPECRALVAENKFDFVLASIHIIDGMDPYYPEFWMSHDSQTAIHKYFTTMLDMLDKYEDFDSLSHLDYIFRYVLDEAGNPDDRNYSYRKYSSYIDPILKKIIDMGKALEVNTGGYRYELGVPNPQPEVLKRYLALGGEKITIGSDGHKPEDLAYAFDECESLLKSLGFKYYEIYINRKPVKIDL